MNSLSPEELQAVQLSLRVATVSVLACLPIAVAVAYVLARSQSVGKSVLDGLVHLPLVLPPVVTGYALLVLFGRQGAIGAPLHDLFGITFSFRWTGAALAAGVMSFPLLVRPIRMSFEAIDRRLELAACTLGAPPLRVFFTVTLPLAVPGLVSGTLLAFAKALGEFGATITFVSNIPGETQTIASAIYALLQAPGGEPGALRLAGISVTISVVALLLSEVIARAMQRRQRTAAT